ncbi:MAG: Maf family protein [Methylacidiphilales bacterium]|nr:Maf family protein [Candidatus Methylacidiphilales bacterium]
MSCLILASQSPRRQELLEEAGISFRVQAPDADEWDFSTHPELTPVEIVRSNARRKAESVAHSHPQDIILAADTLVYCEGRLLGKPLDAGDAVAMLKWLSARTHEVLTAVAWRDPAQCTIREHVARTRVTFRSLDENIIHGYMEKVNVMDKAGAYGIQEHGSDLIERIEGSKTNVIGLPMEIVSVWWAERA